MIDNTRKIKNVSAKYGYLLSEKDIESRFGLEQRHGQEVPYSRIPSQIIKNLNITNLYFGFFWNRDKKNITGIIKTIKTIDTTSVIRASRFWQQITKFKA